MADCICSCINNSLWGTIIYCTSNCLSLLGLSWASKAHKHFPHLKKNTILFVSAIFCYCLYFALNADSSCYLLAVCCFDCNHYSIVLEVASICRYVSLTVDIFIIIIWTNTIGHHKVMNEINNIFRLYLI